MFILDANWINFVLRCNILHYATKTCQRWRSLTGTEWLSPRSPSSPSSLWASSIHGSRYEVFKKFSHTRAGAQPEALSYSWRGNNLKETYLHEGRHIKPQTAGRQKRKLPVFDILLLCQNGDSGDGKGYILDLNKQHVMRHIPRSHLTSPGGPGNRKAITTSLRRVTCTAIKTRGSKFLSQKDSE